MKINITLIQTDIIWEDIKQNQELLSQKINSVKHKTDLIILPEMFATGFSMHPKKFAYASEQQIEWMKTISINKKCTVTGSIINQINGRFYNSLIWMNPDGLHSVYNKRHLFTYAGEHLHYSPGNQNITPELNGFKIRPLICYDLRFPVWSRNRNDYDLLIYIANWPHIRISAWNALLKARAIENLAYVAGVNRVGLDANQIPHSGYSCLIDYKGNEQLSFEAFEEGVKNMDIDLESLNSFREKFPADKDADEFNII